MLIYLINTKYANGKNLRKIIEIMVKKHALKLYDKIQFP